MDWNNLTPIQLMALGAQTAFCNAVSCRECRIRISRGCENAPECHRWAIENPKETLKFYGVAEVDGEAALITLVDENNRLRKENADQTTALAEALSAKEALEVDLGDLKAVNDHLREENAALSTTMTAPCWTLWTATRRGNGSSRWHLPTCPANATSCGMP